MAETNSYTIGTAQQTMAVNVNRTYSFANNSVFFATISSAYYDYYYRIVKSSQEWIDGYVVGFHDSNNGIFSTKLASSLVSGIANQIVGEQVGFTNGTKVQDDKALDFISHDWAEQVDITTKVRQLCAYGVGLGTSALKLNSSLGGKLWVEVARLDYFKFAQSGSNDLLEVEFFIRNYMSTDEKFGGNYVISEHRFYEDTRKKVYRTINGVKKEFDVGERKPKVEYRIYRYTGQQLSNQQMVRKGDGYLDWEQLPKQIKNSFKNDFGVVRINEPKDLPFRDLGVYLYRFNGFDVSVPNSPFGTSVVWNIQSELYAYDLAFSFRVRDMFLGKGTVGLPKMISQSSLVGGFSVQEQPTSNPNLAPQFKSVPTSQTAILSNQMPNSYELIDGLDPNTQKPIVNQFDLREEAWERQEDSILRRIATKIQMSPKVIASYLGIGLNSKTATESDSEDDTIVSWVNNQRHHLEKPINDLIETVLNFYGKTGNVVVRFSTPAYVNADRRLDSVERMYRDGFIDLEEAIRKLNPDMDEKQLAEKVKKAKLRQKEIEKQRQLQLDSLGDYADGNASDYPTEAI